MRLLIDIGHPAHVHLFKNFYYEMVRRGHESLVTVKEIPAAIQLLDIYKIPFISIGSKSDGILKKAFNQFSYNKSILSLVRDHKIEMGLGTSITLAHVSAISGMRSLVFDDDDDDVQPLMTYMGHPFADHVISPDALKGKRRKRSTVFYKGYHELAYLHPDVFIPDRRVLAEAGLNENEPFFILRFNAFRAHHDRNARGLSDNQKKEIVRYLEQHGRIIITSESLTGQEFKKYQIRISSEKIHSLIYFSTMLVGESQTMTSEASVLGVPSIRCNTFAGRLSVLEEEEKKYGLTYAFSPDEFDKMMDKLKELLAIPGLRDEWHRKRKIMIDEKINVTSFMVWLAENYPESIRVMKENPEYQNKFLSQLPPII
ncbi:MAG TPA: hypothetical protein DCY25_07085 [Bacteroidales bacterium]|nr:hypothetical protein [Bacteroidales bacterium]